MALNYSRSNKAFSLLELIISIAILSTGIVIILQALSFSARVTGLSCDIVNAVLLAEDKLQDFEFKEKHNLLTKEPNAAAGEADKFKWQYTLSPVSGLALSKLDLRFRWQRAKKEENLDLSTYLRQ